MYSLVSGQAVEVSGSQKQQTPYEPPEVSLIPMTSNSSTFRAWLQLIRPPNLFTVPGDPLAGYVVACVAAARVPELPLAVLPVLAALCLYVGGLIGNDVADEAEDLRDRPGRPIPSGRVTRLQALAASAGCVISGFLLALAAGRTVFYAAVFTQTAICAYNGGLKRFSIVGALVMGACRGGSVLLGATAAGWPGVSVSPVVAISHGCTLPCGSIWAAHGALIAVAAGIMLYIAAVTAVADRETEVVRLGVRRWLPLVALLGLWCGAGALLPHLYPVQAFLFCLLGGAAMAWAGLQAGRLRGLPPPPVVGRSVGALIRGLLLVQAGLCALGGTPGLAVAVVLLTLWPLSGVVSRWFYAS